MILITGASGNAGGAVLNAALALNLPVRAMYRKKEDARNAPKDAETVFADYSDRACLRKALAGIESIYLVCAPIPQLVELESNMIDACKEAGVHHIVLHSALGAGRFQKSFPSWHLQVETKLCSSGMDYTILRPNGFMQNIATFTATSIRANRAFYAAMGDARTSLIDVRDVGAVAAQILSDPTRHSRKCYELNGPEAISHAEIAERISQVIGTKVSFVDIPVAAQRQAMLDMGMPDWQVTAVLDLQEYYRSGSARPLTARWRRCSANLHGCSMRTSARTELSSRIQPHKEFL